ncbi:MAG: TIGR03013 family PEP-CTERM/XrtA system glycosyltransferase [Nitrospira sp.]|nr:TIGR03013 family PEP-CTERM/XrtA system glycosyltransferase [Nitrospira sp.]
MFSNNSHLSIHRSIFFLTEGILVFASIFLATAARFSFEFHGWVDYEALIPKILFVTAICQLCLYYNDLYGDNLIRSGREIVVKILQALGAASLIVFTFYYLYPPLQLGRGIFFITLIVLPFLLIVSRSFYGRYICLLFRDKVLIIGTDAMAKCVGHELVRKPDLGYELVGFIDQDPAKIGMRVVNPGVIGAFGNLVEVMRARDVKHVIVALDDRRGRLPLEALLASKLRGVRIEDGVGFYERLSGKILIEQLRPSWLIFGQGFRKNRLTLGLKRATDEALSTLGLSACSPIFLLLALLIKLTSPGPVFYRQERVGEDGRIFTLYKFRSMRVDAEEVTGPVWAEDWDPRVTPIGRIMRKLRLDELPQMFNVLKGEMSFVGPRPERPAFVQKLRELIPYYDLRFSVKPGITGWAQILYHYGGTVEGSQEKLQYELYYIKNMSLVLDLFIMLQTVKVVLFQKGAR